jgi:tetratricopeptide (TPR) repeat protein
MKIYFKKEKFLWIKDKFLWCRKYIKESIFIYPLLLSLISALIFYYFFNVLPRRTDFEKIKPQIEFHLDKILSDGMFIVTEMTHQNISQKKYYSGSLTLKELELALKGNYFDTKLKYVTTNKDGNWYCIGEFVSDYISEIQINIDIMLRYIIFLNPELIKIINELQRNGLFETWDRHYPVQDLNIDERIYKIKKEDLSKFKNNLFKLYKTLQKLEQFVEENFYNKLNSLKIKASKAFFYLEDYKQAIKYNRKILKIDKNNSDALFYLGASYIKDAQLEKGIKVLKNALTIHPDLELVIKSNIDNKLAIKKIFQNNK